MNETSLNQSPLGAPQKSSMGHWVVIGVVAVVILGGAIYLIPRLSPEPKGSTPPPPFASNQNTSASDSLGADEAIAQDITSVTSDRSAAAIDEDIEGTNTDALEAEVDAMNQEAAGL